MTKYLKHKRIKLNKKSENTEMVICEHEKNIERLFSEFGESYGEKEIRKWYTLKRDYIENTKKTPHCPDYLMIYTSLRKDLHFSFPDNVPRSTYNPKL